MIKYKLIENIVFNFYLKATKDGIIGHFFTQIDNFDEHIPRIARFWYYHLNGKKMKKERFEFLPVHNKLDIRKPHLGRWVILFVEGLSNIENDDIKKKWEKKINIFQKVLSNKLFS